MRIVRVPRSLYQYFTHNELSGYMTGIRGGYGLPCKLRRRKKKANRPECKPVILPPLPAGPASASLAGQSVLNRKSKGT